MSDKAIESIAEKPWEIKKRMQQHDFNRGSKFPPFSIEPQPYERQRLSGKGMSAEDRALRGQWVKDQILSPDEPRNVEHIRPRNIFRRIYGKPMDVIFRSLEPVIGKTASVYGRAFVPRTLLISAWLYYAYYTLKYNAKDWTDDKGWAVYGSKNSTFGDRPVPQEMTFDDFCDRGFKARTVLLDGKTSAVP